MRLLYINALAPFLLGALLIAIFWPGLHGGFVFDDGPSILQAEGVKLDNLSIESLRQAFYSGGAGPSGRPIAQLSFAFDYFFNGFNPFAFKATNLAIHLINGLLIFWLAKRLLIAGSPQTGRKLIKIAAVGISALWLLHPIQLLPVLHVVQRMTSLSALFLLAALLLHIRGRERQGISGTSQVLFAWGILWPLSYFTKEIGALFPFFVLAWELCIRKSIHGGLDLFARSLTGIAGLSTVLITLYLVSPAAQWLWAGYDLRSFSLLERLMTETRVLWFYLGLIFFPRFEAFGLYHDDIAISTSLFSPASTLPSLVGLSALIWVVWYARHRAPLVSFGIAWFLIGHAMESTFLPLEIAHEHRNYLPLFGVLVALASIVLEAVKRNGALKTILLSLTLAAVIYFPLVTSLRSHQFGDDGRRTQVEAQHHRLSSHAQFDAGSYLATLPEAANANSSMYAFARKHYELAAQLDRSSKSGLLGQIDLDCKAGKQANRTTVDELSVRLRQTPFAPADRNILYILKDMVIAGTHCLSRKDMDALFTSAISNPTVSHSVRAFLYSWQADYLVLQEKDLPAAKQALAASLKLAPANPSNRLKWAQLILLEGHSEEAMRLLQALQNTPLSSSEKKTMRELEACVENGLNQCSAI